MSAPLSHRASTAHLQAAYPFVAEGGLGTCGPYIGRDLFGGSFCFDPWELYRQGALTGPNMVVVGQIGRGKSTFVKTYLRRAEAFGRQAWVVDPKGEYGPLAAAAGAVALRIAPGGPLRLNPLDAIGGLAAPKTAELLCSIVASSLGHDLTPGARTAAHLALQALAGRRDRPCLPDVVAALLDPSAVSAAEVGTDVAGLAADGRDVALELRRLVEGDLAGMFDGPTSPGIDLSGPLVVLDLSALYGSPALGILMTCATAWLQAALAARPDVKRLVVVDEAWAILRNLATARWLQSGFKLSRALGVANIAVVHRLSDLRAAGADGSETQQLAQGLLADAETRVVFAQPPSEVDAVADALGLSSTEAALLPALPRGVALWKVGSRSFVVEHALGAGEAALVDTDAAMRVGAR
ncbi:MAG: ATP-binding protein [Actinomycetota bacterium]|nr:ATP-binding protein [Actinomycetota bacterium]